MEHVPTLERAKALGLSVVIDPPGLIRGPREVLKLEPTRVVKQAAVIVIGSYTRRMRTPIERSMLPSEAAALPAVTDEPPVDKPLGVHAISLRVSIGEKAACANDTHGPGYVEHTVCQGMGCTTCNESGRVTCSTCRGEGGCVRVETLYVTEERTAFHNVYSPGDLPLPFDNRLQSMLGPPRTLPDELEWHGKLKGENLGYRDAAKDPRSINGFSLLPAVDTALRFLDEVCGGADESARRVFGWPLLRLYYEGVGQAVIFTTPDGGLEALGWAAGRYD